MAHSTSKVIKLPITAWIVIDGQEFEVTSVDAEFTSSSAAARVTLAVGTGLAKGVNPQVTVAQAEAIKLDAAASIFVKSTTSVDLPGYPSGERLLLKGYIVDSGPWRASGADTYGWGVEIIHTGIADLTTGSTSVWPFTTSVNFDWKRPNSILDGQWISSMIGTTIVKGKSTSDLFTDDGLWPTIQKFFVGVASGGTRESALQNKTAGVLATNSCIGSDGVGINTIAIAALNNTRGTSDLKLRGSNDIQKFVRFIDQMLANDLRTMSFLQQIQTLGDRCFFRLVPKSDGSVIAVPFKTFEQTTHVTFDSDVIFSFNPSAMGDTRVSGLILYGDPIRSSPVDSSYGVYGCYRFNDGTTGVTDNPRGVIETVPAPSWLGASAYDITTQSQKNFNGTVETSAPDANSVQEPDEPVTDYNDTLERYGDHVARELARQYRFRGSSVVFSSYLRFDVCPQSTVQVNAPSNLGTNSSLFGKVDKVRIIIDAPGNEAKTEFTLAYTRNKQTQEGIGSYDHPIYTDGSFTGEAL